MTVKIEIAGMSAGEVLVELRGIAEGLLGDRCASGPATVATVAEQSVIVAEVVGDTGKPAGEAYDNNRLVGKAGGDRARRTKAEISEDVALMAIAEKAAVPVEKVNDVIVKVGREQAEAGLKVRANDLADKPAISTGEERIGPEDDPATEAQDTADEKAEADASRDPAAPLTAEDLKNAMGGYVKKFGLAETQADGPAIFAAALGAPPAGEQFWKVTLVAAAGQDLLWKAIDAWNSAAAADARYAAKEA